MPPIRPTRPAPSLPHATGFDVAAVSTTAALALQSNGNITQSGAVTAASLAVAGTGAGSLNSRHPGQQPSPPSTASRAAGGFALNNGNNNTTLTGNHQHHQQRGFHRHRNRHLHPEPNYRRDRRKQGPSRSRPTRSPIAANTGNNALATSGVLTLKAKTASRAMSLAGAAGFDLTAAEITAFATGATGPIVIGDSASTGVMTIGGPVSLAGKTLTLNAGSITDAGVQTITAQNVSLKANGQIGTDASNGIDVAATNL